MRQMGSVDLCKPKRARPAEGHWTDRTVRLIVLDEDNIKRQVGNSLLEGSGYRWKDSTRTAQVHRRRLSVSRCMWILVLAKTTHSSGATERGLARIARPTGPSIYLLVTPHHTTPAGAKQIPAATETLARSTFGGRPSHVLPSPSSFRFPTPPDFEPQPPAKAYSSYRVL